MTQLPTEAVANAVAEGDGLVWVDFDHTDEQGMSLLTQLFEVRLADLQDCHVRTPVSKLHAYPDHHFSAINGLARGTDGRLYLQPLKVFLGSRSIVTVLGPTSGALSGQAAHHEMEAVRRRMDSDGFCPETPLELITAIRREMMNSMERLIGSLAARIAEFEQEMMERDPVKSEELLQELFALRHDLQTIRTSAAQAQESYTNLIEMLPLQEGILQIDLKRLGELRQGFAHIMHTTDLEREYLQEMLDLFQTRVSTELNRFVRKVTAWGTVAVAWTVIAGVYGMNFTNMPELTWDYGYPYALALMLVSGLLLAIYFRRHGWL